MSSSLQRSLATGGSESFCIWDTNSYGKIYSHCPSTSVVSQSWSLDGSCLASLPKHSNKLLMTYSVKGILRTSEVPLHDSPIKALSFPRTSNMKSIWVSHGSNISQILLSSPKAPSKDYSLTGLSSNEVVSCLALNIRDDHAILGTNKGRLKLVNLVSGYESSLSTSDEMNVNDVRYNNIRHALLGSASDSGTVAFWDVHARKKLSSFRKHASPASGITFSPVNEMLVLSSGLDKKCICYDAKEKKPVSTISTDYPLTCVDFKQDGFILALGTSRGRVLVYDLRSYDSPIQDFEAHGTFVHSIKYAMFTDGKRSSFPKPLLKDVSSHSKAEMSPILQKKEDSFKDDTLGSTQGFSPLRRDYTSSPLDLSSFERHQLAPLSNNTSTESMFSPLREGIHSNNSTLASIVDRGNSFSSPLGLIKEETIVNSMRSDGIKKSSSHSDIMSKTKSIKDMVSKTASIIKNDLKTTSSTPKLSLDENKENKIDGNMPYLGGETSPLTPNNEDLESLILKERSEDVDMRHILTAFPSCLSMVEPTEKKDEVMPHTSQNAPSNPPPRSGTFQQAYLENIVKNTVKDYSRELTGLIWSARYESIKMFYELSDKIEETVLEASPNTELIEENKRLKQEIEILKSYY